jgi:hypothetical protein
MPYSQAQFIGYAINTAPSGGLVKRRGHYEQEREYLGSQSLDRDVRRRCEFMLTAVRKAYTHAKVKHDASVLKVFMAPEFYFRGPYGGYQLERVHEIVGLLQEETNDSIYKNWLFVFGSIIGFSHDEKQNHNEIYNIVPVIKGAQGADGTQIVIKEYKSGIDFLHGRDWVKTVGKRKIPIKVRGVRGLMDENVQPMPEAKPSGTGAEKQKRAYGGGSILEIDGITFGVEVCLDHLEQRLRKSPVAYGEKRIQIQLVPSAGMDIKEPSVVAIKGGLVFNCDGSYILGHGKDIGAHSQAAAVTTMCSGSSTSATLKYKDWYIAQELNGAGFPGIDRYYAKGPGQLHVYEPMAIPSVSTRRSLFTDYSAA